MKVYLGSIKGLAEAKQAIIKFIESMNYEVVDLNPNNTLSMLEIVDQGYSLMKKQNDFRLILLDYYGFESFMIASKYKDLIVAELEDEHSARMTRDHNSTNTITIGYLIIGYELAKNIIKQFLESDYSGGRHQVRIDMLHKILKEER
ncbi:MAG: RpiB/LacA/LacB family sugar-phosphate isomerase [Mycoplasmoidaceae bacterium]